MHQKYCERSTRSRKREVNKTIIRFITDSKTNITRRKEEAGEEAEKR